MPDRAGALPDLDGLWDYDHPDRTEASFRALLPRTEADPAYRAELLSQLARALGLQRRFDEAHAVLDGLRPELDALTPRVRVRYHLERGRVLNSSGRKGDSIPPFEVAWDVARAARLDALAVDAAHMLGIVVPGEAGVSWNDRALALAESSEDPGARRWRPSLLNNIGWSRFDRGEHARALDHFQRALVLRKEAGAEGPIRIARWCVAKTLRVLGRLDEALAIQQALLADVEAGRAETDGYVYEEMGECLLARGDVSGARPWFGKAHAILSKDVWLPKSEPERIERMRAIADGERDS